MLSPDFIVDDNGRVYVEEVNTNGFIVGDNNELFKAQGDTIDMLRFLGADGWPKRPLYTTRAASIVNDFLKQREFDEHDAALVKPSLLELVHEEVAAFPTAWYRIFPAQSGLSHLKLLDQGEGFATDLVRDVSYMLRTA